MAIGSLLVAVALIGGCGILIAGSLLVVWALAHNRRPPSG
jgi:hypothetical protein